MSVMHKMLMAASGGSAGEDSFWISLNGNAKVNTARGVASDSNNNVLVSGYGRDSGGIDFATSYIYNTEGTLRYGRGFRSGNFPDRFFACAFNSAGDFLSVGEAGELSVASGEDAFLVKYLSDGFMKKQKKLEYPTYTAFYGVDVASDDYPVVVGKTNVSNADVCLIAKYDNGTNGPFLVWQRTLTDTASGTSGLLRFYAVSIDSNDNLYAAGEDAYGGSGLLVKYNSSGVLQWQKKLGSGTGSTSTKFNGCATDSSGNIYVSGSVGAFANNYELVVKYNSSGVVQWQKKLGDSNKINQCSGVAVDSSGNVYTSGTAQGTQLVATLCKYNSAGVLQFQRQLDFNTDVTQANDDQGFAVSIDSNNNVLWCGKAQSTPGATFFNMFVAKLPRDGTLTGTYGPAIYSASSLTSSTPTLTTTTPTFTDAASSLTDVTPSTPYVGRLGPFNLITIQ